MQKIGEKLLGLPFHDGPECLIYKKYLFDNPKEKRAFQINITESLNHLQPWEELHNI